MPQQFLVLRLIIYSVTLSFFLLPPFTGTIVRRVVSVDPETGAAVTEPVIDLDQPNRSHCVARGGRGGSGNCVMLKRSSFKSLARVNTEGEVGEGCTLELELKLIADVGLVGYPNAGKSSLLSALSHATPKIAAYPFTTLHPHVGVVEQYLDTSSSSSAAAGGVWRHRLGTTSSSSSSSAAEPLEAVARAAISSAAQVRSFTMADLPGLIDGAHADVGLGHEFLKHIERTKVSSFHNFLFAKCILFDWLMG